MGCVIADMRHDRVHTLNRMLDNLDIVALDAEMVRIARDGEGLLAKAGVAFRDTRHVFELDMLYLGQTHTVAVPLPVSLEGDSTGVTADAIRLAFESAYTEVFGRLLDGIAIRVMNLRVSVIGVRPKFDLALLAPGADGSVDAATVGTRRVWADGGWVEATVYERLALPAGAAVPGPAVLEQADTTIFIEPDLAGTVDRFGNLLIERKESA